MKRFLSLTTGLLLAGMATANDLPQAEKVAYSDGVQITGVTVSESARVFVNAPNWRDGVPYAVAEVNPSTNAFTPYPDEKANRCVADSKPADDCFLAVQSVVAHDNKLYVLDTRNPKLKQVVDTPRIFVVDLSSNAITDVLMLAEDAYHSDSYINDLRVDDETQRIYLTDSNHPGLVVYNLNDDTSYRILDGLASTTAEVAGINVAGTPVNMTIHSDGIALDSRNRTLYFHALSGYTLYSINTSDIKQGKTTGKHVRAISQTGAPDGMIYDGEGNLYLADLEHHKVQYLTPSLDLRTLVEGDAVSWADTFSIHEDYLYYTNSKIQHAGQDVTDMEFEIYRVPLP
ncbi:major royal jelly family protein [Alteromonas sp. ASW11-19]|uniref:Major royal jelly family protein n=1 Tax=Alteromonas salexigens TaxID=2982530 RepID=A0ABT2VT16_9ALTE|nr:major royal jelly family protein [Alteromonas salexigens]MCU7555583.1 major royal jelly family protein [Alteromonas salexigens]